MTARAGEAGLVAFEVRVTGLVQGVGFRPFVHRLATRHRLAGSVSNRSGNVEIHIEGAAGDVEAFLAALRDQSPVLARIDTLAWQPEPPSGIRGFAISASRLDPRERQPISPDVATCARCEVELFDPANRRYRYPFITCTDCGPRFTVIDAMPYDRVRTSMRRFQQCAECLREYGSPGDRRFHSETNSCPECGPRLWIEETYRGAADYGIGANEALRRAAAALCDGQIVALKGLGGFHLAVDATSGRAVERLRQRKHRDAKPLAVMVRTIDQAEEIGFISPAERSLLLSPERPVVVLRRRPGSALAGDVSPGINTVGIMLAYTPLHHLLLDLVARPLVMTSGNRSEEPIAITNEQAREELHGIADLLLLHDRDILSRYDDSVIRVAGGAPVFLRRARGHAPLPVSLPAPTPQPLLAVGAQLKNTLTLAVGARAFVSQHIGDLDDAGSVEHFEEVSRLYRALFNVEPRVVAHDAHPDYRSTRIAEETGLRRISVQHHHAHIAAVMAEHGVAEPVVGVAYDGAGYGEDGNTWGGEILVCTLTGFRRAGHLRYAPLPGGDLGARKPWRAAVGLLSLDPHTEAASERLLRDISPRELDIARQQVAHHLNAPLTSSMGRLFDAAAALLGVRSSATYEGQAAMELEALASQAASSAIAPLPFPVERGQCCTMDPVPLINALASGVMLGRDRAELAAAFHESVACATDQAVMAACEAEGIRTVALGGGVFQNARLLVAVRARLASRGIRVLVPVRLSPNDGAISYGQAAVASARLLEESEGRTCA